VQPIGEVSTTAEQPSALAQQHAIRKSERLMVKSLR
jgi:hypothetical protein